LRDSGARRYWWIWIAVVPVAGWTFVRLLGLDGGYPLATLMAFTPYAAVAALLLAGVAIALRNWAASTVAALATVALALVVLPRAIGDDTVSAAGHETLDVLAANVHRGTADPEALLALVDRLDPDVLSVEELTPAFARKLARAGLGDLLPHALLDLRPRASGGGLYSRLPIRPLVAPDGLVLPDGRQMPVAKLRMADGRAVRIVGVHPDIPGDGSTNRWEEALASLPSGGVGAPWVLAGDFNATLDQAALREVLDRGYRDAADVAGEGLEPTFPRAGHLIPPVTIDHVLADRRLGVVEYSVEDLPGSDHRAVYAMLALP
jgi:endonuclease/exonuclease/phosphatase (EEP) superfamily protein YafD